MDEWRGIRTDSLGRVETLDLTANGLAGELPSTVEALAGLAELQIRDNPALAGRLPNSLRRLSLSVLHYAGTGLCSPAEDSFRTRLDGVASHEGTDAECAPVSDRDILSDLYRTTDGPNWVNSDNWLTDAPLGEWYGVETDASGRVVSMKLFGNDLSGPIRAEPGRPRRIEDALAAQQRPFGPAPSRRSSGDLRDWRSWTWRTTPRFPGHCQRA